MHYKYCVSAILKKIIFCCVWLILHSSVNAEQSVFIPNMIGDGPVGIYLEAEYKSYDKPIEIDFKNKQLGNDSLSILTNYYHYIYTKDKSAYIDLYTDKDGGHTKVISQIDKLLSFKPDVEVSKIELNSILNWGKLILPGLRRDIIPELAGLDPTIFCDNGSCYISYKGGKSYIYTFYSSLTKDYSRIANSSEQAHFKNTKEKFQSYHIVPPNSAHQTPGDYSLYPSVYLNLQKYSKRWNVPLTISLDINKTPLPKEVAPIIEFFTKIKSLSKTQIEDKQLLGSLFTQAFGNEGIVKRSVPLFWERRYGYDNGRAENWRYVDAVWRWNAIIPVGYIQHGRVKYIYFYPVTDFYPVNKEGSGIIQMLPVSNDGAGYKLDYRGLSHTYLSALQFPEAIQLASNFYDTQEQVHELTTVKTENIKTEVTNDIKGIIAKNDTTSENNKTESNNKFFWLIIVLLSLAATAMAVFYIKFSRKTLKNKS